MIIYTDAYEPYEFNTNKETLKYILERAYYCKKSIKLIEKDTGHLTLRCPVSGDYLDVFGQTDDIEWLDTELTKKQWYRIT